MHAVKPRTIRFPHDVAERGAQLAEKEGTSFNELVVRSVEKLLRETEDQEWAAGFELLGRHPEISDVTYMEDAVRELMEKSDDESPAR